MYIAVILLTFFILLRSIEAQSLASPVKPVDVCEAVRVGTRASVVVRGLGRYTKDEFVMGDFTCPVAQGNDFTLPAMIQVQTTSFATPEVEATFAKSVDRKNYKGPFVQVLVRGALSCPAKFSVSKGDGGDIGFGNGFGEQGLIICQLRKAHVLLIHRLE